MGFGKEKTFYLRLRVNIRNCGAIRKQNQGLWNTGTKNQEQKLEFKIRNLGTRLVWVKLSGG